MEWLLLHFGSILAVVRFLRKPICIVYHRLLFVVGRWWQMLSRLVRQRQYKLKVEVVEHTNLIVLPIPSNGDCVQVKIRVVVRFSGVLSVMYGCNVTMRLDNLARGKFRETVDMYCDDAILQESNEIRLNDCNPVERSYQFTARVDRYMKFGRQAKCRLTVTDINPYRDSLTTISAAFEAEVTNNVSS